MPKLRKISTTLLLLTLSSAAAPDRARASYVSVNLNPYTNEDIRQNPYQTVAALPTGGATLTVGNTPFTLATFNGKAGTTGVVQTGPFDFVMTAPPSVDIAVNIGGALEVDTLINSTFGSLYQPSGRIQFLGTGGAFASFDLVQGTNIRDYNVGSVFNNAIAAGTNTIMFTSTTPTAGGTYATRLDEQVFILPKIFASQTLTTIRLVNLASSFSQGAPFLAAASVVVPEPASAVLVGSAMLLGLVSIGLRRTRKV